MKKFHFPVFARFRSEGKHQAGLDEGTPKPRGFCEGKGGTVPCGAMAIFLSP
jgi:hypothetical protein